MNEFDDLKSKPKAKRRLKGVHFQFKGAEVSYTSPDLPAASGEEGAYLIKSNEELKLKPLTDKQKEILELIGEEQTPLEKSVEKQPPSSDGGSGIKSTSEDEETAMNEVEKALQDKVAELEYKLTVKEKVDVVKSLTLEDTVKLELAEALASVDSEVSTKIEKAFGTLQAKLEEGEKAVAKSTENPIVKALQEEEGHEEVQKSVGEMTYQDRVRAEIERQEQASNKGAK